MTTASQMTIEHLGPDATERDLRGFRRAVARLMERDALTEQEATDLLWGNGDYYRRARKLRVLSYLIRVMPGGSA